MSILKKTVKAVTSPVGAIAVGVATGLLPIAAPVYGVTKIVQKVKNKNIETVKVDESEVEVEKFEYEKFEPEKFEYEKFELEKK